MIFTPMRTILCRAALMIMLFAVHIVMVAQNNNEFGYPIVPNLNSSINAPVGKISDEISVSQSGAASYSIGIKTPSGVSGMAPSIGLNYNSQSGNGIAGWGCNLTGVSVITRTPSDIYHEGMAGGITYNMDGPFCLDGQRLIICGGIQDGDSITYNLEFSPLTQVVLHGISSAAQEQTWFSVHTPDGNYYEYGHTTDSQQRYTLQGTTKVNAWYVCSVRNPVGGQCNYSYSESYNSIYPHNITYGNNVIRFAYETRPDTVCTAVEGIPVKIVKRLASISTATTVNGIENLFRRYTLSYNCNDGTTTSYSRLVSIDETNGNGESLRPTILTWNTPQSFSCQKDSSVFETSFNYLGTQRNSISIFSADMNGDGLSDIVQYGYTNQPGGYSNNFSYIRAHYAYLDTSGKVNFRTGDTYRPGGGFNIGTGWNLQQSAPVAADMDGDGIMELLVPEFYRSVDGSHFGVHVYKKGIESEVGGVKFPDIHVDSITKILWTIADFNNDGIAEIVAIEQHTDGSNYYGVLMGGYENVGAPHEAYNKFFRFNLSAKPQHLFSADMDCDGLTDLVVFYNHGYSVIRNTGNWLSDSLPSPYIPQHTDYALNLDPFRTWQGDFNGDNISDFLVCKPDNGTFYFELGNGNGNLVEKIACTLDIHEQSYTHDDNDSFFCQILDFDGDGKTDVVVHKSMYDSTYVNTFMMDSVLMVNYNRSEVYWLRSDGNHLIVQSHASTNRKTEEEARFYAQGDFNGDGLPEVASYSFDCYDGTGAAGDAVFRIYRNASFNASTGKLVRVTDGMGIQTNIAYTTIADANVRIQETGNNIPGFPVIRISAPLNVVSSVTSNNGAAGQSTKNYRYGTLLGHVQGRGILGMTSGRTEDESTGLVSDYCVTQWDTQAFVPRSTRETNTLGSHTSTCNTNYYIIVYTSNNHRKYLCYPKRIDNYDFDGNHTWEENMYQPSWGMLIHNSRCYTPNDLEVTEVFDCVYKGGRYQPVDVGHYRYHSEDPNVFMEFTHYAYNDKGLVDTLITNYDTELAITTKYTYDNYGNRLSESVSANGVSPIVSTWQYDDTHRFVTRHVENGLTETLYTHDLWGNVLTETDNTRTAHPLTRTNTYDNWGNLTESESPLGIRTTYTRGWGNSQSMRYFEVVQGQKQPWKKTWYDAMGREVKTEGINDQGLLATTTTTYDNKGQATTVVSQAGDVSITQTSDYDNRGRCTSSSISDAQGTLNQTRTYAYGSNWKSETFNGRETKQTFNHWGDVAYVTTPQDTVTYHYYSSRQPSSVTSCGHTVTMTYDEAGNRTSMTDPDAGTMTYTYDGMGRIISQTDARNQTLNYTYDSYGRVKTGPVGSTPLVTNYYGSNSSNKNLLTSAKVNIANKVIYTYDDYGRILSKKYRILNEGYHTLSYTYDSDGLLATKTYPDGTTTAFHYDAYGNHVSTTIGDTVVWQMAQATGSTTRYLLANVFQMEETCNGSGLQTAKTLRRNNTQLHNMTYAYDPVTENLTQRTGMRSAAETFTYDALERLTQADNLAMTYSADGNMLSKTDIGRYYYEDVKPHAVTSIDNSCFLASDSLQTAEYNACGKVRCIQQAENLKVLFDYSAEGERQECIFILNGQEFRRFYFGDYEEVRSSQGTKSICYLDGGVIAIRDTDGNLSLNVSFTDNLGSVTRIYGSSGNEVFNASYDVWGNQTVNRNDIDFYRGYTGHEMLTDFGLINMNGRLYDPLLGRFLSTDNFVQEPFDSQNFNRYSYCLNNPLKYTDPSGEIWWIPVLANICMNAAMSRANGDGLLNGVLTGLTSSAMSIVSSGMTNAIGGLLGHQLGGVGTELFRAGLHGISQGIVSGVGGNGFWNGFAIGGISSLVGSGLNAAGSSADMSLISMGFAGGLTSALTGGNLIDGFMTGLSIGTLNHRWEVLPDGTPHCILDEVVVKGKDKRISCLLYIASMQTKTYSRGFLYAYNNKDQLIFKTDAVSGSWSSSYTIPEGNYKATQFIDTVEPEFSRHKVGFKVVLGPDPYDPYRGKTRSLLRIHPARGKYTAGCIGLITDNVDSLKSMERIFKMSINNNSIPLGVSILNR